MRKSLKQYAKDWKRNAEADPLWVILTHRKYYDRKWDVSKFFATGEEEIERVFNFMKQHAFSFSPDTFLDFGCGVGRVSRALKRRFAHGYGIDISARMIELARQYVKDVQFMVNTTSSLATIQDNSIDFVYSHLVLQHIPNEYSLNYIDEFLRILKPKGLAVFQVPTQVINAREEKGHRSVKMKNIIKRLLPFMVSLRRRLGHQDALHDICVEMHTLSNDHIEAACRNRGCIIEAISATNSCDTDHEGEIDFFPVADHFQKLRQGGQSNVYLSSMFFVRKPDYPATTS